MGVMVCSGFSPKGRQDYGEAFLRSFDRWAAPEIKLGVWVEEPMKMPRDACRDLWAIPGAREFHAQHADNLDAQGRVPHGNWKAAEKAKGYSFRTDAYKFWKQILIPGAAAEELEAGEILVWFDADVEFTRRFDAGTIEELLGEGDVCFLNRARQHSEIGFWAVRLNNRTRAFLVDIASMYRHGAVFDLPEWHSAFVWDHIRRKSDLRERHLCTPGAHGHVWPTSPLGSWSIHYKGPRKVMAR